MLSNKPDQADRSSPGRKVLVSLGGNWMNPGWSLSHANERYEIHSGLFCVSTVPAGVPVFLKVPIRIHNRQKSPGKVPSGLKKTGLNLSSFSYAEGQGAITFCSPSKAIASLPLLPLRGMRGILFISLHALKG